MNLKYVKTKNTCYCGGRVRINCIILTHNLLCNRVHFSAFVITAERKTVCGQAQKKGSRVNSSFGASPNSCFSSSRLFSRIICRDSSRCIPSPSRPPLAGGCISRIMMRRKARRVHPSLPLSLEGGFWRNANATRVQHKCTESLCAGRPRHTAVNSNFSSFSRY